MKLNEWVLTVLQVAAPVYCFSVGMIPQGIFLTIWIVFFGVGELVSKKLTGSTLSQNVWKHPRIQRVIISALMVAGMVALAYHFIFGGGN